MRHRQPPSIQPEVTAKAVEEFRQDFAKVVEDA